MSLYRLAPHLGKARHYPRTLDLRPKQLRGHRVSTPDREGDWCREAEDVTELAKAAVVGDSTEDTVCSLHHGELLAADERLSSPKPCGAAHSL